MLHIEMILNFHVASSVNDLFFLKNDVWGKIFLQAWNHFIPDNNSPESCGYYDRCPFGVSMLQVSQDYSRMQQQEELQPSMLNWSHVMGLPYNQTLEDLAWRSGIVQQTLFKDELGRLTASQSKNCRDPD
jgi:hypothetical protein